MDGRYKILYFHTVTLKIKPSSKVDMSEILSMVTLSYFDTFVISYEDQNMAYYAIYNNKFTSIKLQKNALVV